MNVHNNHKDDDPNPNSQEKGRFGRFITLGSILGLAVGVALEHIGWGLLVGTTIGAIIEMNT